MKTLRIVAWNCKQGLDRKLDALLELNPDIAVVPEAGERLSRDGYLWKGKLGRKGVGVLAQPGIRLDLDPLWDEVHQWFVPIRVRGPVNFTLIAVWAMNHRGDHPAGRHGETLRALRGYESLLRREDCVLIGDWNNNAIWDKPSHDGYGVYVAYLASLGYRSIYHVRTGETSGNESRATFFLHHQVHRPYQIDHAYVHENWLQRVVDYRIEPPERWLRLSDHVPIVLDLATHRDHPVGTRAPLASVDPWRKRP